MGGGNRHLPSRKKNSSPTLWGEERHNADSGGGMKNWQEEKSGSRRYQKTGGPWGGKGAEAYVEIDGFPGWKEASVQSGMWVRETCSPQRWYWVMLT